LYWGDQGIGGSRCVSVDGVWVGRARKESILNYLLMETGALYTK